MKNTSKQINAIGVGFSYLSSVITRSSDIAGMPPAAGIEVTNYCNLKCPQCSSGSDVITRARGYMKKELYNKFISEATPWLFNINLYFQGEPMLHPEFFDFIEMSGRSKVTVSTNGHFLSQENCYKLARSGIEKVIVSLDGMDRETYSRYRVNGDMEKVVGGIRNIFAEKQKCKSSLKLEIQLLVNKYNESQIGVAKKFAREVNASLKLKSMQILNFEEIGQWLPLNEKFRRYRRDKNGAFVIRNQMRNNCLRLWMNPVITWDGKVLPCCFDKDADHIMGDLNENSLRDIWHGEKFKEFRRSLLKNRKSIEICRNCTSGLRTPIFLKKF